MEVQIKARDYKISPDLREFIQQRVNKLDRFVGRVTDAKLELNHQHPRTGGEHLTAQLTIATRRAILRAEEQHADPRRAVDLVVEKMCRRIKRYHDKRVDHGKRPSLAEFTAEPLPALSPAELAELDGADAGADGHEVVRTKRFALKPMSSDEAIDQLELLGHDFFVFLNADDNRVNVLYRRKSGDYGLIQPL